MRIKHETLDKTNLTPEILRDLLEYDPETGVFVWRVYRSYKARKDQVAGRLSKRGYRRIRVRCSIFYAHQLAWLYMYGCWPPAGQLDHKNLNRDDNRIANLREATNSQNKMNSGIRKDSQSGYRGVTEDKRTGRWRSYICMSGKRQWLGYFGRIEDAIDARTKAAKNAYGEFFRE